MKLNFLLQGGCWNYKPLVQKNNFTIVYFLKYDFSTFSEDELKKILKRIKNYSAGFSKGCFTCPEKHFEGKQGFRFFEFEGPTWRHPGKLHRQDVKTAVFVSRRTIWGIICFPWIWKLNGKMLDFSHRHDRQNCALHLQMMFLKRMCKLYCPENFQPFHENFNRCVKAEFYVLREAFRKNMSLFRESLFFLFRT